MKFIAGNLVRNLTIGVASIAILSACGRDDAETPQGESLSAEAILTPPASVTANPKGTTSTGTQERLDTDLVDAGEAAYFLMQAGFGANPQTIEAWTGANASDWVSEQMALPPTLSLPRMKSRYPTRQDTNRLHSDLLMETFITAEDELRQRMVFALSEIFVISDRNFFDQGYTTAQYTDIFATHAFGNYRDILEEVTFSPAMAEYLTYMRNEKGDLATGRMPDENYAREVLQLFSIGLVDLNMDGTPKRDANGEPIESYTNDDVIGLARVFTGFSYEGSDWWDGSVEDRRYRRLKIFNQRHSPLEKRFLGQAVGEFTQGEPTVAQALDVIANHPNVPPFMARQLIQRFTASSPEPDYIERVARAFDTGQFTSETGVTFGSGARGDMGATIAAVLLDPSQHDLWQGKTEGKVREPILKFVHAMRAFDAGPVTPEADWRTRDTSDPSANLGQHILRSPSVFNFFRPGFIAPGTESGAAGLTAPEMAIVNSGAAQGYINFMGNYLVENVTRPEDGDILTPDYTDELALASDPVALVEHLNTILVAGRMNDETKASIIDIISTYPWPDTGETEEIAKVRVTLATLLSVTAAEYEVLD